LSSQSVLDVRPTAFQTATALSSNGYAQASVVSICASPAFEREFVEEVPATNLDGLGCARGIRAAFLLEGAMALFFYGIWHFWHLAR
jgi:hypothetical protein